jgi:chromosomal replication initiator protein
MKSRHERDTPPPDLIQSDKSKTFKSYITGPANQLAYNAAIEIANNPGGSGKYPELYIYGESGLGKTHIINAIANRIIEVNPELKIKLRTAKKLMDEMISLMKVNRISDFHANYTEEIDVLIVDDIQEFRNKEGTQEQFLLIIKELQRTGKKIIYASDLVPEKLSGISNKVITQFKKSLIVDIQSPDLETSVSILEEFSKKINFTISKINLVVVAENTERNPAKLEGALLRIKAASELLNIEIHEEFIKKELSSI